MSLRGCSTTYTAAIWPHRSSIIRQAVLFRKGDFAVCLLLPFLGKRVSMKSRAHSRCVGSNLHSVFVFPRSDGPWGRKPPGEAVEGNG